MFFFFVFFLLLPPTFSHHLTQHINLTSSNGCGPFCHVLTINAFWKLCNPVIINLLAITCHFTLLQPIQWITQIFFLAHGRAALAAPIGSNTSWCKNLPLRQTKILREHRATPVQVSLFVVAAVVWFVTVSFHHLQ